MEDIKKTKKELKKGSYSNEYRNQKNRIYYSKNKEKIQQLNKFSSAKMFIRNTEDLEKLEILKELVSQKIEDLTKN